MMTSQKVGATQPVEDTRPRSTSAKSSFEGKGSPEVNLISLAYSNRAEKIAEYLKKNPALEITAMRDIRHYSVLHIACINNQAKIFQMFCDHVKAQNLPEEDFREWVNARTDEGYSAIHFASFKGSLELIRLLEGYGASIDAKNDQGLSVLHIAAQGDHPISLAYFLKKGLDLQELDVKGSTPLHWAAFLGMENATNYLTSWGSDPNLKDSESGFTPLHLAVISGNSRVVRRLLLKGADRRIRDNENKTPKDLALENEYGHIAQLLEGRNWLIECFNIKPGFQRKRTKHSLALLVSLFSITIFLNLIFLFPYVSDLVWVIFFFLLCGLTITFFVISWQKNPGYMVNKKNDILDLLVKYESYKICPECVLVKPERSKHCDYCGKCVAVFDHHCPWIDNCVGAKNHKYFLMFIFSTLLSVIYFTLLSIFHISQREPVNKYSIIDFEEEAILFDLKEVVCVGNFILTVLFAVPLSILNYVQICNFISGKTTNERFGFNKSGNTNRESVRPGADMTTSLMGGMGSQSITISETPATIRHNKRYKHSFVNNCRAMCFTNAKDYDHAYQSHQSLGIN